MEEKASAVLIKPSAGCNTMLNVSGVSNMKKIYCRCGQIIGLDSSHVDLKIRLGKDIECTACRNMRISMEIDELNSMYRMELQEEVL